MPYHMLSKSKYETLGLDYPLDVQGNAEKKFLHQIRLYYCPTTTNKKNKFFESLNAASQLYQRLYRMFNAGVFILTSDS